jgi:type I restriction enzyme S subunit
MELKPRYKQTEVGELPTGWELVPFSELLEFRNGVNADKAAYGKGVRFINVLEVITRSHLRASDIPGRISLPERVITSFQVRKGDVVFNRTSETQEEVGLAAVYTDDEEVVFGGFVIRGRPMSDANLDIRYSGYALRSPHIRQQVVARGQGAIRANIGQQDLRTVLVPRPPRNEQLAIAAALSDVDALIGALDRLISKKRDLKQSAMQQLLTGQTRLPGFNGKWETKPLGDVASIRNQKVLPHQVDPDTFCIELEHLGQGNGRLLASSTARSSTSSKYRFVSGDVLFGRLRSYLRKYWLADRDGICTTEIWPLVVNPSLAFNGFLHALVQTTAFVEMAGISYGTHMPRADWAVVRAFQVSLPRLDEQAAIAAVLSDMDAELASLGQCREKTRLLKQGMMQELLTGRTRLV